MAEQFQNLNGMTVKSFPFKILRAAFAAIAMVCVPSMAASAPIIIGSVSNVTGISGLVVAGGTYDVQFSTDSYATTFASGTPTFLNNNADATAAAQAIASLFLAQGVTGINGANCNVKPAGVSDFFHCSVVVPNAVFTTFGSGAFASHRILPDGSIVDWSSAPANSISFTLAEAFGLMIGAPNFQAGSGGQMMYAVFSPQATPVPEPGTLTLIGLGFVGVAASRRRKP